MEAQIEQHLSKDDHERFWEGAMDDLSSGGALVCFGEEQRLAISMAQMDRLRKIADEGKSERLQAERHKIEWFAGAADRAKLIMSAVHNQKMRARQVRRRQMGYIDDLSSSEDDAHNNCSATVARRGLVVKLGSIQDCSGW